MWITFVFPLIQPRFSHYIVIPPLYPGFTSHFKRKNSKQSDTLFWHVLSPFNNKSQMQKLWFGEMTWIKNSNLSSASHIKFRVRVNWGLLLNGDTMRKWWHGLTLYWSFIPNLKAWDWSILRWCGVIVLIENCCGVIVAIIFPSGMPAFWKIGSHLLPKNFALFKPRAQ